MDVNNIAVLSLIVCIFLILFLVIDIKGKFDNYLKDKDEKPLVTVAIIIGILFLLYGLLSPFISDYFFDFRKDEDGKLTKLNPNELGDTLGGTIGPFVAAAGVIFTFLTFYMQKLANDDIKKQFKIQQFENQFYEMVRLHKENVNEIELERKDNEGVVKGRAVFYEMKKELEVLLTFDKEFHNEDVEPKRFVQVYKKFWWGFANEVKVNWCTPFIFADYDLNSYDYQLQLLKNDEEGFKLFDSQIMLNSNLKINFLNGHHTYLGHYFRHLFQTVKYVVNQNFLSFDQKLQYLRILRAQLSNYEQVMLFYNWLSGYGAGWENEKNKFFTEFKMIHNLWYSELYEADFISKTIDELKNIPVQFREGNLFESDD